MPATFALSAFGDEIADDLASQLEWLRRLAVRHLELRTVGKRDALQLDDGEVATIRRTCVSAGVDVAILAAPIGRSALAAPIAEELAHLERVFAVAEGLGTRLVRVFSFQPPDPAQRAGRDAHVAQASARLARLAEAAGRGGFTLLLENEPTTVGDTPERCHALLSTVSSPHLRFAWSPAGFIAAGVARPTERGWPALGAYVAHVHVGDARGADGRVCIVGEGDGQVRELLRALRDAGYRGFLSLEPRLLASGTAGGFSGPGGMIYAVAALRQLMADTGCGEQ